MVDKVKFLKIQTDCEDLEGMKKNVLVACRVRPLSDKEKEVSPHPIFEVLQAENCIKLLQSGDFSSQLCFSYDKVFSQSACQKEVFEEIGKPIIDSVLEGFNGTILTYGQTCSGKTYTMIGPDIYNPLEKGLIPRIVHTIFQGIKESSPIFEFTVKVAYLEIYLEKVRDLILINKKNLKISEDKTRGIVIKDLTEEYVSNESEVFSMLKIGNKNREVASTMMNEESSRSHAIFMITITQNNTNDLSSKTGKLYLVDLAGSEKLSKTGAEGKRLDETKNINKSLSTLGNVIFSLTDGKSTHIPYRDSKLTRVLQDSLGGNSKTSLIITVSPSSYNELESLSTLRFGVRAKAVKNKPKVNKELSVAQLKMMLDQANECISQKDSKIMWLEKQVLGINNADFQFDEEKTCAKNFNTHLKVSNRENIKFDTKDNEINELKKEIAQKGVQIKNLNRENDCLNEKIGKLTNSTSEYLEKINDLVDNFNKLQAKNESQEKQILCLLDTNRNLDKKIEEMQKINNQSYENLQISTERINTLTLKYNLQCEYNKTLTTKIFFVLEDLQKSLENIDTEIINHKISVLISWHKIQQLDLFKEIEKIDKDTEENRKISTDSQNNIKDVQNFHEKVYSLEKNLEQLNLMYQILSNKYASTRTDIGIYEKKILRKNERILALEKNLKKVTEQANSYKYKFETSVSEISDTMIKSNLSDYPKIKKMIKGGNEQILNILCPYSLN